MADMIAFCTAMLDALVDFLMAEPIFYLYSLVLFCFIAKVIMTLMGRR